MSYVYVDASGLDDRDIVKEVTNRYFDDSDTSEMIKWLMSEDPKISWFLKIKDNFSLFDLEQMIKSIEPAPCAMKNQMPLFSEQTP